MMMRKRMAELVMRGAATVGRSTGRPRESVVSLGAYRLAGALVCLLGGRLESRVMAVVAPEDNPNPKFASTLGSIRAAPEARGIALRIATTRLSREEALRSRDVRPLVPDGVEHLTFYEFQAPTHSAWKATKVIEDELKRLREIEGEGQQPREADEVRALV
jgi:hypothetical protein